MQRTPSACFVVAPGGVLSKGYGYNGPGVCQGDVQTHAKEYHRRVDARREIRYDSPCQLLKSIK